MWIKIWFEKRIVYEVWVVLYIGFNFGWFVLKEYRSFLRKGEKNGEGGCIKFVFCLVN